MKRLHILALALLGTLFTHAQDNEVGGLYSKISEAKAKGEVFVDLQLPLKEISSAELKALSLPFEAKVYNLDKSKLGQYLSTSPDAIRVMLPNGVLLEMVKGEIFTPDARIMDGLGKELEPVAMVHYQGIVSTSSNRRSMATMSLWADGLAVNYHPGGPSFTIEKLIGSEYYALVDESKLEKTPFSCGASEHDLEAPIHEHIEESSTNNMVCNRVVRIHFELANSYFVANGSNLTNTQTSFLTVFNNVRTFYANDNIAILMSKMIVWQTLEPYTYGNSTMSNLDQSNEALNTFKTNLTSFNGDLAHLVSSSNLARGGVAYRGGLCSNRAFAYGYSNLSRGNGGIQNGTWPTNAICHELGHQLSSPHTHSCLWAGGPIDNCACAGGTGLAGTCPEDGNCAAGPIPAVWGGTVMSYCHSTSTGVDMSLGFGPLPRQLIQNYINSSNCLCPTSFTVNPTVITAPTAGGTFPVTITSTPANSCYAVNNGSFATVPALPSNTDGRYATTLTITVPPNTGASRLDILNVSSCNDPAVLSSIRVSQAAGSNSFAVSPSTILANPNATTLNVTVTGSTNYTVSSSPSGIISHPSSGTTSNFAMSLPANTGPQRIVTVTFTSGTLSRTVTVTQQATSDIILTPATRNVTSTAGSTTLQVQSTIPWTAAVSAGISLSPTSGQAGTTTVNVTYTANTGTSSITKTATFSGGGISRVFNLVQSNSSANSLSATPTSLTFLPTGSSAQLNVIATAGLAVTLSNIPSWITATPTSGVGSFSVNLTASAAGSTNRSGVMTLSAAGVSNVSVSLSQNTNTCTDPNGSNNTTGTATSLTTNGAQRTACIEVLGDVDYYAITASGNVYYAKVEGNFPTQTLGAYLVSANLSGSTLVVETFESGTPTDTKLTLYDASGSVLATNNNKSTTSVMSRVSYSIPACTVSASPANLSFQATGGTQNISISATGAWSASTSLGTLSSSSGTGNASISLTLPSNSSTSQRSGTVSITCGSSSASVGITQQGQAATTCTDNFEPNPSISTYYNLSTISGSRMLNAELTSNDDDYFRISWNGTVYFVRVKGYNSSAVGCYTLTVTNNSPTLTIETTSYNGSDVDTEVLLYSASGVLLGSDDDSGTNNFSLLNYTPSGGSTFTASPTTLSFTASGSSQTITTSGCASTPSYSNSLSWITVTRSGSSFSVTAASNSGAARSGTFTLTCGSQSITISVSQAAGTCTSGSNRSTGTAMNFTNGSTVTNQCINVATTNALWYLIWNNASGTRRLTANVTITGGSSANAAAELYGPANLQSTNNGGSISFSINRCRPANTSTYIRVWSQYSMQFSLNASHGTSSCTLPFSGDDAMVTEDEESIMVPVEANTLVLSPNPSFTGNVFNALYILDIEGETEVQGLVRVVNPITGVTLSTSEAILFTGPNEFMLQTPSEPGVYLVSIATKFGVTTQKLLVQ